MPHRRCFNAWFKGRMGASDSASTGRAYMRLHTWRCAVAAVAAAAITQYH